MDLVEQYFENSATPYCLTSSSTIRLDVLQGMPVEVFSQKIGDLTCLCSTLNIIQPRKLDPTLKPSSLKEITDACYDRGIPCFGYFVL